MAINIVTWRITTKRMHCTLHLCIFLWLPISEYFFEKKYSCHVIIQFSYIYFLNRNCEVIVFSTIEHPYLWLQSEELSQLHNSQGTPQSWNNSINVYAIADLNRVTNPSNFWYFKQAPWKLEYWCEYFFHPGNLKWIPSL